jgi:CRP/FNR family cyclic AMP-dependent transcriptional regulator
MEKAIHDILESHPFFEGISPDVMEFVGGCGRNARFDAGDKICREGDPADSFYAILEGRVAVQIHMAARGPVTIMTLEGGDILGWSWLFPPYRWSFDVIVIEPTRTVQFNAPCLRGKCEDDTSLGYDLMKRFAGVFARRLAATRQQVLDVYAKSEAS